MATVACSAGKKITGDLNLAVVVVVVDAEDSTITQRVDLASSLAEVIEKAVVTELSLTIKAPHDDTTSLDPCYPEHFDWERYSADRVTDDNS